MEWLKELENCNISFHMHVLQKQDAIFMQSTDRNNQIIHILDGFIQLIQVFTNSEKVCVKLLHKRQTIINKKNKTKKCSHYYLLVAIAKTTIITIPSEEFNKKKERIKLLSLIQLQRNEKDKVIDILSHRNTKKRVVQLLITLTKQFGQIKKQKITLPLDLPHETIAIITGSQRITISRVMNKLKKNGIINYSDRDIIICSIAKLIRA